MARIANTKKEIVLTINIEIQKRIRAANAKLQDELNIEGKFNTAYIDSLDNSAKTDMKEAVQLFRWLIENEFGLTPPSAFTDAEIDIINIEIRTHEEEE